MSVFDKISDQIADRDGSTGQIIYNNRQEIFSSPKAEVVEFFEQIDLEGLVESRECLFCETCGNVSNPECSAAEWSP